MYGVILAVVCCADQAPRPPQAPTADDRHVVVHRPPQAPEPPTQGQRYNSAMTACQAMSKPALVFVRCDERSVLGYLTCRWDDDRLKTGVYVVVPGDTFPVSNWDDVLPCHATREELDAALGRLRARTGPGGRVVPGAASLIVPAFTPAYPFRGFASGANC